MKVLEDELLTEDEIRRRVTELGQWFHNLDLRGVKTAPRHFLGDYPEVKWQRFAHAVPADLSGKSVLDVGCNAGFYSIQMKNRGAERVVAIDTDEKYLDQGRFAAKVNRMEIEFRNLSVYRVAELREQFDLVLFMGVLYHLRHPLLALDLLREHVVGHLLVAQSMVRGSRCTVDFPANFDFWEEDVFEDKSFPRLHFVEQRFADDPTNWWIPNQACFEAMLRSAGFAILDHPEPEVFVCRRARLTGPIDPGNDLREITR
jgi:tRNA (mo5U34)-methyltransferase